MSQAFHPKNLGQVKYVLQFSEGGGGRGGEVSEVLVFCIVSLCSRYMLVSVECCPVSI